MPKHMKPAKDHDTLQIDAMKIHNKKKKGKKENDIFEKPKTTKNKKSKSTKKSKY